MKGWVRAALLSTIGLTAVSVAAQPDAQPHADAAPAGPAEPAEPAAPEPAAPAPSAQLDATAEEQAPDAAEPLPLPPPIDVSTAADSVIELTASRGRLHSAIVVEIPAGLSATVTVSSASIAGEQDTIAILPREDHPRAVDGVPAGAQRRIILAAASSSSRRVWLAADGLRREAHYHADLAVEAAGFSRHYHLIIDSRQPYPPLGLRAKNIVREPAGTLGSETFRDCIAVDVNTQIDPVVVLARDPMADAEALVPSGKQVRAYFQQAADVPADDKAFRCEKGLTLEVGPLPPGNYAAVAEINGEPVALRYNVRQPRWLAFMLVLVGGFVAFVARSISTFRRTKAGSEQAINVARRGLVGRKRGVRWDEIQEGNILRKAVGSNRAWLCEDVPDILAELETIPKERPELDQAIEDFDATHLPRDVNDKVAAAIALVRNTSTEEGADRLDARIVELSRMRENGFREPLVEWLQVQQQLLLGHADEIRAILPNAGPELDPVPVKAAVHSLEQALEDAWMVISQTTASPAFDKNQLYMLELVVPTAERMVKWLRADLPAAAEPDWVAIRHLWLPPRDAVAFSTELTVEGVPRLTLRYDQTPQTLVPLTFAVEGVDVPAGARVKVLWQVAGEEIEAGREVTFVLAHRARAYRAVSAQLSVYRAGQLQVLPPAWFGEPISQFPTRAKRQQQYAFVADTAVSFVGGLIVAGLASAVAWDQQFTDLADYAILFSTGLGVDLGLGGGLLGGVMDRLLPRRDDGGT